MNRVKKWAIFMLTVIMMIGIKSEISAATFDVINSDSIFLKQNTDYTCPLASSAMMVLRGKHTILRFVCTKRIPPERKYMENILQ